MFGCILTCCPQGGKNRTWQPRSLWQEDRLCLGCPAFFASQDQGKPGVQQAATAAPGTLTRGVIITLLPKNHLVSTFCSLFHRTSWCFGIEGYFAIGFCVSTFSLRAGTDFQINFFFCCKRDWVLDETHKTQKGSTELC